MFPSGQDAWSLVYLFTPLNAPCTGIVTGDVASIIFLQTANTGTIISYSPSVGNNPTTDNMYEIDSTNFPGFYLVKLLSTDANPGTAYQVAIFATAAKFTNSTTGMNPPILVSQDEGSYLTSFSDIIGGGYTPGSDISRDVWVQVFVGAPGLISANFATAYVARPTVPTSSLPYTIIVGTNLIDSGNGMYRFKVPAADVTVCGNWKLNINPVSGFTATSIPFQVGQTAAPVLQGFTDVEGASFASMTDSLTAIQALCSAAGPDLHEIANGTFGGSGVTLSQLNTALATQTTAILGSGAPTVHDVITVLGTPVSSVSTDIAAVKTDTTTTLTDLTAISTLLGTPVVSVSDDLATANTALTAIQGAGFTTGDDLHTVSANVNTAASYAQSANTNAGTAVTYASNAATSSASADTKLTNIEGTSFSTSTDSLHKLAGYFTDVKGASWTSSDTLHAIQIQTTHLPASPAAVSDVTSAVTSVNSHTDTAVSTLATSSALTTVGTNVTAVKAKTDLIGTSSVASTADVTTSTTNVNNHVDTAVSTLATASTLTSVKAKTDLIGTTSVASTSDVTTSTSAVNTHTDTAVSSLATSASLSTLSTTVSAVKTKTDSLPTSPADEATLTAIKGSGWSSATDTLHSIVSLLPITEYSYGAFDGGIGGINDWVYWQSTGTPNTNPTSVQTTPNYTGPMGSLTQLHVETKTI